MLDASAKPSTGTGSNTSIWQSCFGVMRIALAGVYSQGAGYRRKLLLKAMNPIAAPPLEIGLDPRPLVSLAWQVEKQEAGYRKTCLALLIVTALAAFVGLPTIVFILLAVAVAFFGGKHRAQMQSALDQYSRNKFTFNAVSKLLSTPLVPDMAYGIGSDRQRVLVHKDFDPFKFAGISLGKWSFTVDVERAAQTISGVADLVPISISEIEDSLMRELPQGGFGDLIVRDVIAVRGEDASILPMISHGQHGKQPKVDLSEQEIADVSSRHPNLVRRYVMFHDIHWDGDLVLTNIVRVSLQGRIFYIEVSKFVLTPPTKEFKAVDSTNFFDKTLKTKIGAFIAGAVASPFTVLGETYNLYAFATLRRSINTLEKEYHTSLESSPIFNYGSEESTRRQMIDEKFDHFSQKSDLDFAVKAFDQTIVELIYRYMEDHGVDVSDLRNKAMAIYNSGILVQGGDVTAQAMAVGTGATAKTGAAPKNPLNAQGKA